MPDANPGLMTIFGEALELSDLVARTAYLDRVCCGDTDLRHRVEALLAAHAGAGRFLEPDTAGKLETPTHIPPGVTGVFSPDEKRSTEMTTGEHLPSGVTGTFEGTTSVGHATGLDSGTVIADRYTLLEVIGEGGMGTVYRASQSEPVKRLVALKLIKVGMNSKAVLARFDAERQTVALMDHPNIARVYDGGTTSSGQPFFVMELVRGVPITEYCDHQRLRVRARLELFVAVCQAVQHAHQKGIIHRDLKPGNVLVTEVDGRPTPKVIDFGVAKATEQKLTDLSFADTGAIVGTPQYMSPEQADPSSMDIDTRTDIYALGVILYELLVGSSPLDTKQFKRGAILEMMRMVREVDPPRPSTKLSTSEALPNIAANRNIEPAQLKRALRGDLDWIVMKSLEKDRTRRYDTANGFAADILRHLAYEPVLAAPPSRSYRLRKFVRKNRGVVIATSLIFLALLGGIAGTTWGLISAEIRRGEAERARADEAKRVEERDDAIGKRDTALGVARDSLSKRDDAIKVANNRSDELKYRLGVSNMVLASAAYNKGDLKLSAELLARVPPEQRGWEWHYLKRQTRGGVFTLYPNNGIGIGGSASFSPDGTRIVTGGGTFGGMGGAKVWDARTGMLLLEIKGHTGNVRCASFSPDGTRIVTSSWGISNAELEPSAVKVWDARSGTLLLELKGDTDRYGVESVSFSPDGTRIVTGGQELRGPEGRVNVWDSRTGTPLLELNGFPNNVGSVSFSPDSTRIVTGCGDGTAKVWDAQTGLPLLELKDSGGSVSFSPDGTRIVTSWEKTKVWDARTGMPLLELKDSNGSSALFSPDGMRIFTEAKVWDARTGVPLLELKGCNGAEISFSPDGTRIVTADGEVWDTRMGTPLVELKGHTKRVNDAAFSPDGSRIVTCSGELNEPGEVKVWDARSGTPLLELKGHTGEVGSVSFSPDGTRIVTGANDHGKPGEVKVWDARTGTPLLELKGPTGRVSRVSFSPDGTRIVTGCWDDHTARVWDAQTGTLLLELKGHKAPVFDVSFSSNGTRIVTGSMDGTAKVWDVRTGTLLLEIKHRNLVYRVSFSPDGTKIVTASHDSAMVWDARTGMRLLELKGHEDEVRCASFSPDGTRIITGGSNAMVWDVRTETLLLVLKDSEGCVAFSPDGTRIVTSGEKTKVWDAQTRGPLLELKGHEDEVRCASFSPDGTRIITGCNDDTARVWDVRTGTPLLELKVHTDMGVAFSQDGTRIVTYSEITGEKLWDSLTGKELQGTPIPKIVWSNPFSPDGKYFADLVGNQVELIPLEPTPEEIRYRLIHTRPNYWRYQEGYDVARKADNRFAALFYLDRLLSMPAQRTTTRFKERNDFQADPKVTARTSFHHPALAKAPYDHGSVQFLAIKGDRLAMRLVAQESLREGKPGPAIPMLLMCLLSRPDTNPPAPPLEELLLAQAYLALKQPDEAKRFYRIAAEWLDRPTQPICAANIVSHCALNPWAGLAATVAPVEDLRRNPLDWESWHECDVFRAEVEKGLGRR